MVNQKERVILLAVKRGVGNEVLRYLGEFSVLKEIVAHFPGRKVFWCKWINWLTATTIHEMQFQANKVALLTTKPFLLALLFFPPWPYQI